MMVHLIAKNQPLQHTTVKVLVALAVIFIFAVPLYFLTCSSSSSPWLSFTNNILNPMINFGNSCNIFRGKWVYYPNGANSYTNLTCSEIFDQQNCMKFGRPDSEFLKWRWKPTNCELPLFNPVQFLELVRGKSMAFVGDSLGRNQMQSLLCLLATVSSCILFNDISVLYKKPHLWVRTTITHYSIFPFAAKHVSWPARLMCKGVQNENLYVCIICWEYRLQESKQVFLFPSCKICFQFLHFLH